VKHQEYLTLELEDDAFTETMEIGDETTGDRFERGINRAQEERRNQPNAGYMPADDARPQCVKIQEDVGKFRHYVDRLVRRRARSV
jgi:hypothetical protein